MMTATAAHLLSWMSVEGIGPAKALKIARGQATVPEQALELTEAQQRIDRWAEQGMLVVGFFDDAFPQRLRDIPSPPALLWVRGAVDALTLAPMLAVVGTRAPSRFGQSAAEALTSQAVHAGWATVSGLALGVDTIAAQATLTAGGRHVAFVANGLDSTHPRANTTLVQQIIAAEGAVVSEQPPGSTATPPRLVARNRLQSGLADTVLIAQTDVRGGTMHTARFALAQGRPVYCPRPTQAHAKNEGLQLLLDCPACELPDRARAFAQARSLCQSAGRAPLAAAITRATMDSWPPSADASA